MTDRKPPKSGESSSEWGTDPFLFARLSEHWTFDLDAAASSVNAKCANYLTKEQDALSMDEWPGRCIFLNPPYGKGIDKWLNKARYVSSDQNAEVVTVIPASVGSRWWYENVILFGPTIYFLIGRPEFVLYNRQDTTTPMYDIAVVVYRPNQWWILPGKTEKPTAATYRHIYWDWKNKSISDGVRI